jgi:DNA invertase Pin-like site-specific DNA recombinase
MRPPKLVAYYRVSTRKQGESGLGLEGQVAAVAEYARAQGAEVLRAYQEVESGKRADRPELARAIAHANRSGATLVIAKLDRLARNVAFLANLMETDVEFVCCDNPNATPLTIHILAAVAEDEAKRISERTKAALAAYKARGGLLGSARPDGRRLGREDGEKGRRISEQVRRDRARAAYADLVGDIVRKWEEGRSLRMIASWLDEEGHTTRRGRPWNPVQVRRVLSRVSTMRSEP